VSVVANVAINVDSSGAVSKLRQVQQGAQATNQAVDKLNTTAQRAAAGIDAQGNAAQRASAKVNGLRNALASLGAGLALRKSFIDASALESAQSRIGLLSKNFQQLAGIQDVAAKAAKKFNLSQSESLSALTDLGNRIGPTGASLEDVANVYEGFNTLLALNKVNSQNAASATLQLNQALGSGRLAGEEFNAISEATPQLLDAVAEVMGRNRSELKKLASDGQISSQVLIEALKRIRTEGAADLETAFGGAFGATRRFDAALTDFSATIGTELLPALTPLISGATEILRLFGQLPGPVKTLIAAIAGLTAGFVLLAPAISTAIGLLGGLSLATLAAAGPWVALAAGITAAVVALASYQSQSQKAASAAKTGSAADVVAARNLAVQKGQEISLLKRQRATAQTGRQIASIDRRVTTLQREQQELLSAISVSTADRPQTSQPTPTPMPTGAGTGTGRTGSAADKSKAQQERLAKQIREQQAAATELAATEKGRLLIAETAEPLQRRITEAMVRQNDIQREYTKKLNESKSAQETLNLQIAQQDALKTNALELEAALAQEIDNLTQPLQAILDESRQRLELEKRYQKLLADGVNPELAKEFAQLELTAEKQTQLLTLRLGELEAAKAKLSAESEAAKALQSQIDKIKEILKLQGQAVATSKAESEEERKKRQERERREQDAKEQAERLKNLYRGVVNTIEDGIVDAISVGINGLINGTKELDQALKEIAAGVLQDIGKMLVRFGVNMLMRGVFPGAFANGGVFTANGIQPFASGGVVNKPTLFPFAEGGTTRTGLMGEAGPEAIMPLRRNSAGRLGVEASGLRDAMGAAPGSAGGSPVLNMSFETSTINGVEYVSRDQLEAAMAVTRRQATRDGANRGMSMTMDRLQQSPSARRKVGI